PPWRPFVAAADAAARRRRAGAVRPAPGPREQRRNRLHQPPADGRRSRENVRREPSRRLSADEPAARSIDRERASSRRERLLGFALWWHDRFREPQLRSRLYDSARLRSLQAGERAVHVRAGPPAGGERR